MKPVMLLTVALLATCVLIGCAAKPIVVRRETETVETVKSRKIVDTGTEVAPTEPGEPEEKSSTRTETKERVIEKKPVVE